MSTTAASTIYNFGIIDNYHHHHHPNNHQHSLNQQNNKRGLTANFLGETLEQVIYRFRVSKVSKAAVAAV
ncbi:hypothetical protein DERP_002752 [Dermatophagoides pteronyssinus]|uniref:Uncharacterized protein n=1 Tax=Dermatophagoides pteronyssinus TaxID=6956 RepID=A0ABQ8JVM0_DERPT|nr:hypothetical protein DERP_002752 [Dermatophagoides pteronyssinus]